MDKEREQENQVEGAQEVVEADHNHTEEVKEIGPPPSLLGMIWSPNEQWDRIKNNPRILIALIIVSLISVFGTTITALSMTMDMVEQIAVDLPMTLSEDQQLLMLTFMKFLIGFIGLIAPVISILIISAIHQLVTTVAKTGVKFKQLFSMNTYIYLITALGVAFNNVANYLLNASEDDSNITNLSYYVNGDGLVSVVLSNIELFSIWALILTALGLHKVAGLTKPVAWIVALFFTVIFLIFSIIGVLLG